MRRRLVLPATPRDRLRIALRGDFAPLLDRLRALRPKLVHAQFGPDGLRALPLARKLGIPLITTFRGYDIQLDKAALLRSGSVSWMQYALGMRRLAREGALFLAVSDALRSRALVRGFPDDRMLTHVDGIDLARFQPVAQPGRERTILHVGRLVEKKGTRLLIRAFARVAASFPDARLIIAGDGPLRAGLEQEAAALGLDGRVRFLSHTPPDEVAELMRQAWLLAVPSITARNGDAEGLPTVVVEAAASGLPVVGSIHAGIPEAIDDGVTGLLVPEGALEPLADALLRLLADPGMRQAFGVAARRLAEERFDARRQAERLETLYDRLTR